MELEQEMKESLTLKLAIDIEGDIQYSGLNQDERFMFCIGMKDRMILEAGQELGVELWKLVVAHLEAIREQKNRKIH